MSVTINFLTEMPEWDELLKAHKKLWKNMAVAALKHAPIDLPSVLPDISINVLLGDDEIIHKLNREYRESDKPTNVLSFPQIEEWDDSLEDLAEESEATGEPAELGDIIMAYGVIARESADQGKLIHHHIGHLLVHGVLHLLGYDHLTAEEETAMERLETDILAAHHLPDPYQDIVN